MTITAIFPNLPHLHFTFPNIPSTHYFLLEFPNLLIKTVDNLPISAICRTCHDPIYTTELAYTWQDHSKTCLLCGGKDQTHNPT